MFEAFSTEKRSAPVWSLDLELLVFWLAAAVSIEGLWGSSSLDNLHGQVPTQGIEHNFQMASSLQIAFF